MLIPSNNRLFKFIILILLFCFIFSTGCATSEIQSIDNEDLEADHKYITEIISIKLNNGQSFSGKEYEFSLDFTKNDESKIYCYPRLQSDTSHIKPNIQRFESYLLSDILSAKVKFKNKPTIVGYVAGGVVLLGVLLFLWWANGERNKRP